VAAFFDVVRAGFGQRRKQLRNALLHGLHLPLESLTQGLGQAGIDGTRRAETLSVEEWVTLYQTLKSQGPWSPGPRAEPHRGFPSGEDVAVTEGNEKRPPPRGDRA
jgi:hypothetical protein